MNGSGSGSGSGIAVGFSIVAPSRPRRAPFSYQQQQQQQQQQGIPAPVLALSAAMLGSSTALPALPASSTYQHHEEGEEEEEGEGEEAPSIDATSTTTTTSTSTTSSSRLLDRSSTHPQKNKSLSPSTSTSTSSNKKNKTKYNLRVVLIDHYDSYTYNLYNILADLLTERPIVLGKDFVGPLPDHTDALVLSPGPGRPSCPNDMGRTLELIRDASSLPILGVCLGHQALAHVHGATVSECYPAVHGQVHAVELFLMNNTTDRSTNTAAAAAAANLWNGIRSNAKNNHNNNNNNNPIIDVTRYHSLAVQPDTLPDNLKVTALLLRPHNRNHSNATTTTTANHSTTETVIMALQHKTLPQYGVQFHPESIGTPQGYQIVDNFLAIAQAEKLTKQSRNAAADNDTASHDVHDAAVEAAETLPINGDETQLNTLPINGDETQLNGSQREISTSTTTANNSSTTKYYVSTRRLTAYASANTANATDMSTPDVFERLYGNDSHAIFLDSSMQQGTFGRWSIMAGMTGPLSKRIDYYGMEHGSSKSNATTTTPTPGIVTTQDVHGTIVADNHDSDILDYLRRHQEEAELIFDHSKNTELPFCGGHIGYLGYEVRHVTQRKLDQMEGQGTVLPIEEVIGANNNNTSQHQEQTNPHVPTAAFLFCDQTMLYDHWKKEWHLVEVTMLPTKSSSKWMDATQAVLQGMRQSTYGLVEPRTTQQPKKLDFIPNRSRSAYRADIADCHDQIRRGESYELCLTNQLETTVTTDNRPWDLYKILRQRNPAPFSAFMNFQGSDSNHAKVSICCSSPERFVSVKPNQGQLVVEAKPIKGTAARSMDNPNEDARVALELQQSVKNRAENLMIVDLLRSDLNRVCQTGTVHVPKLMAIESYATVHQLVSTIRGELDFDKNIVDVLTACFPGGSMTGAPKRRTMEILHEMEESVSRGPYSGCLGYISLNGHMDMNIVIRSAVLTPSSYNSAWDVRIGAGGAITALSESDEEYEEMLLKARAVKESVELWASCPNASAAKEQQMPLETQNWAPIEAQ